MPYPMEVVFVRRRRIWVVARAHKLSSLLTGMRAFLFIEEEMEMTNIFIGGAFPYANGSLHIGHIASLLGGDILARYYRLKGHPVLYVAGSDCHGTPISVRAQEEGVKPNEITNRYHTEFVECFNKLGFTYDLYTRTDSATHRSIVQEIYADLHQKGFIYDQEVDQAFCEPCNRFLPDRFVEGRCPHCDSLARGDQCDTCSTILEPTDVVQPKCKLCKNTPIRRKTVQQYFALSKFQYELKEWLQTRQGWRENAIKFTTKYLSEGLPDRAATRELDWGIDVPLEGYEGKKIYVWIEAVLGYLSASKEWSQNGKGNWEDFWGIDVLSHYVHGKDNIPFHSIILPSLLLATGNLHLPDRIVSNEYVTLEGKKISTSKNWAIWVPDILERYDADSIRYFLTVNAPEKKDANFSWREFIYSHNAELLGDFGNLVNRTLTFVNKFHEGKIKGNVVDEGIKQKVEALYFIVGKLIEQSRFKEAIEAVFDLVRKGNKYFDEQKPWISREQNPDDCEKSISTCIYIIANLSNLLEPFLPFTTEKIRIFLEINEPKWKPIKLETETTVKTLSVLFERIDVKQIEIEKEKLLRQ